MIFYRKSDIYSILFTKILQLPWHWNSGIFLNSIITDCLKIHSIQVTVQKTFLYLPKTCLYLENILYILLVHIDYIDFPATFGPRPYHKATFLDVPRPIIVIQLASGVGC